MVELLKYRISFFIGFIFIASCAELSDVKSLKLAHSLDVTHPVHKGMEFMTQKVAEKSNGKLTIEIYPSQQLGTERQCLELLQIGSLAMTKVSAGVMENFSPKVQILCLPYIFDDKQHAYKVLDGPIGKRLLDEGQEYWLKGLTYFDAGYRSFYTQKPINTPDDLNGLKIRVMESATAMDMVKSMGGAPTPISWGELYTALQQGIVDGAENNPPSFYLSKHFEICKYYTLNEHTYVPDILVIGTVAWNGLTENEKSWLEASAEEATVYQRNLWAQAEQEALDAVIANGVEVLRPDKEIFAEKTGHVFESFKDQPEMYSLIQQIRSLR